MQNLALILNVFYILLFILGMTFSLQAQEQRKIDNGGYGKIRSAYVTFVVAAILMVSSFIVTFFDSETIDLLLALIRLACVLLVTIKIVNVSSLAYGWPKQSDTEKQKIAASEKIISDYMTGHLRS